MLRVFCGVTVSLAAAASVASAQTPSPSPAIRFIVPPLETAAARATQTQAAPKSAPAVPAAQGGGRWWNDASITVDINLSATARASMDRLMDATNTKQMERQRHQAELRSRYEAALTQRQWDDANKLAAEMSKEMSDIWSAQMLFKVEALRLLTPEQQQTLFAKHPYLLQRMWIGGPGVTSLHFEGTPRPQPTAGDKPK